MDRRKFIGGGLVALVSAIAGQKYILKDPLGKLFAEKPIYESSIDVAVGKFIYMPGNNVGKNLTGIVEEGFDSSKVLGKEIKVYGKERKDSITQEMTGFVQVDKIEAKNGSKIYKRAENKTLIGSDFPSREIIEENRYLSPKNFTYKNEDAWRKLGTNKIKLTGKFSDDYQWIYVKDEKDGETNKIKVENISDWIKYQLQNKFEGNIGYGDIMLSEIYIYALVKNTIDAKERIKTRELFTADVNHILPKTYRREFKN